MSNVRRRSIAIAMTVIMTFALTIPALAANPSDAYASTSLTTASTSKATQKPAKKQKKAKLKKANVTTSTLKYTGRAQKPDVTVKCKGKTLKRGRDYTLTVTDSKKKKVSKVKDPGTYTATVKGKGAYTGKASRKFKVYSKDGKKWGQYEERTPVYKTIQIVDKPAWTEFVYDNYYVIVCSCGEFETRSLDEWNAHDDMHWTNKDGKGGAYGIVMRYNLVDTIEHPATTHDQKVLDHYDTSLKWGWI